MRVSDFLGLVYVASGLIGLTWFLVLALNALGLTDVVMWPSILIAATVAMFSSKIASRYFYRKAR